MSDTSIVDDEIEPPELDDPADELLDDEPETDPPEDEPDASDEPDPEPLAAREPARRGASEVIRESKRRAKEAEERTARLEREMADLRTAMTQPRMSEAEMYRAQQAEQERLQLMSPEERADYRVAQAEQRIRAEMQQVRFTSAEAADKAAFKSLAQSNPLAKKYAVEVEADFARRLAAGKPVEREIILQNLVGKAMIDRAVSASAKQGKAASRRVAAAEGRPARAGGDTASDRSNRGGDLSIAEFERKYGNVKF